MNWLFRYKLGYANEEAYLRDTLRGGVNTGDYYQLVVDYLLDTDQLSEWDKGISERIDFGIEWLDSATKEQEEGFLKWLKDNPYRRSELGDRDPYSSPVYENMDFEKYVKATWLIHFTNDARSIVEDGFKYGHPEIEGVHLTMWKHEKTRKKSGGYNFAFIPGTNDMYEAARSKKYGNDAVLFWGSGVKAYHYGDGEKQVIFWGPSVNINWIFPIMNKYNKWMVSNHEYRVVYESEDIGDCVKWIQNNYHQLQSSRGWEHSKVRGV